ncbi:MAG: hypothetical protein ACYDGR_17755, partial [Candidatus Dormibacteria bacterium]
MSQLSAVRTATFVVLIPGEDGERIARTLHEHTNDLWIFEPQIYLPEVRGKAYFEAEGELAANLDEKWREVDPDTTLAIFIMVHEEGLQEFMAGLQGEVMVGVPNARVRSLYQGQRTESLPIRVVMDTDPTVVMEAAMQAYLGSTEELSAFVGYEFNEWWLESPKPWESARISEDSGLEIMSEDEAWGKDAGALTDAIARQMAGEGVEAWPEAQPPAAPGSDPEVPPADDVFAELEVLTGGRATTGSTPALTGAASGPTLSVVGPSSDQADESVEAAVEYAEIPVHIQRLPRELRARATADWLVHRGEVRESAATAPMAEAAMVTSGQSAPVQALSSAPVAPPPGEIPPVKPLPQSPISFIARAAWPPAPVVEEGPLGRPVEPVQRSAIKTTPPPPPPAR